MGAKLLELAKGETVLAGSGTGRNISNLLWKLAMSSQDNLFVLDFRGIKVVTSSFIREAIVLFKRRAREELPNLYPVLSNLSDPVEEEFPLILNQMGEVFWLFKFNDRGAILDQRLLGRLDPKLQEALDLINKGQGFDAATLWRSTKSEESVGVTAWNNRLANLSKLGLVFETKVGKQKYFRPLYEGAR